MYNLWRKCKQLANKQVERHGLMERPINTFNSIIRDEHWNGFIQYVDYVV